MAGRRKTLERRKQRRAKKIARKMAQRALYAKWRDDGVNNKSKRAKLRARELRKKTIRLHRHAKACGNIGCKRCNPIPANLCTPTQLARMC